MNDSKSLNGEIEQFLIEFDKALAVREIPIDKRPMLAADIFIRDRIISVDGVEVNSTYIDETWFKHIIRPIKKWYESKYGCLIIGDDKSIAAVMLYNGVLIEYKISSLIKEECEDQKYQLIFPRTIYKNETITTFIKQGEISTEIEKSPDLKFKFCMIVQLNREIATNLITSNCKSIDIINLIEKGVTLLTSKNKMTQCSSIWELFFAIEQSLKLKMNDLERIVNKTHKLKDLIRECNFNSNMKLRKWIGEFPSDKESINYRYGQGREKSNEDLFGYYVTCLKIVALITSTYKRKYVFDNTSFTLRRLKWQ